jgi:hypothetical protein
VREQMSLARRARGELLSTSFVGEDEWLFFCVCFDVLFIFFFFMIESLYKSGGTDTKLVVQKFDTRERMIQGLQT